MAEQNQVRVAANERTGSLSGDGIEGDCKFGDDGIHGKFAGHRITGAFSFEIGTGAVTITDKPFWLPELLLKRKVTEGLDTATAQKPQKLDSGQCAAKCS